MAQSQKHSHAVAAAIFGSLLLAGAASAQTADTVLFNGKILTVDKDFSTQQALATGHGRVLASGTSAAMKKLAGAIGGVKTRGDAEAPSRRQALEMYTRNSAFMANDDDRRGTLEPGKFADLAVLSSDYLTAPVKEIGKIKSVLTMVGGDVVYADAPFAGMAAPAAKPR